MIWNKHINIEATAHVVFWLFIFSAVNVEWASDWFDKTLRPSSPAPLVVLIFPFIFYANSLWAIPKYLDTPKWKTYILCFILIFIVPELVRVGLVMSFNEEATIWGELKSRDSFLFGQPSIIWMAMIFSFAYRFTKDWFVKQRQINELETVLSEHLYREQQSEIQPLDKEEADVLQQNLDEALRLSKPYLNPELCLAELAKLIGTTDKKLSILLNHNMHTNFYDYINSFRVTDFKKSIEGGKLEHLSIVGLALQCGFKSKSSFYRAFKKDTGMSPSQFIK